jgi:hypothetical protein
MARASSSFSAIFSSEVEISRVSFSGKTASLAAISKVPSAST